MTSWPRTDAEQIRNTRTFEEARVQLDARQASSAASGGLALQREVTPTCQVGEALAPVIYGMNGDNVTLDATSYPQGRAEIIKAAFFPNQSPDEPTSHREPSLSDLYITGYGARRKQGATATSANFNLLRVYLGNGAQGNTAVGRDVVQLPAPFNLSPAGDGFWYGGWTHLLGAAAIPVQADANITLVYDFVFDTTVNPSLAVNIFWLYEYRPSEAAGFARFYPRTG